MAVSISQSAQVDITINGEKANKKLQELIAKAQDLRKKIDDLKNTGGDPKQLKQLETELKKTDAEINRIRTDAAKVEDILKRVDKASPKELNSALNILKKQLNNIERGSDAWKRQTELIKRVKLEISKVNAEMKLMESGGARLNNWLDNTQKAIMAVAAVAGLIAAGRKAVSDYAEMEEQIANTRKYTGMSEEDVRELNEAFKNLDTRVPRDKLNELAQEAGRLGKNTLKDVQGYVEAAQIINVALVDLGEGATQTIAKLTNIFGVDQMLGTKQAMLAVGSAVNVLSQNCTASKPYLVEFAQRMAGIGAQAGMSIPEILAFGAVLDANGQKVEMSATALQKVLMNLANKNKEFAQIVGLDAETLKNTLEKSAKDGILMFLEALQKIGNATDFNNATLVLAPALKEMGLDAARVSQVLSTLAMHLDEVKWQLGEADKAFNEASSASNEFGIFNNTVQADIDKAKARIKELSIELGENLLPVMKHIMTGSTFMVKALNETVLFFKNYGREIAALILILTAYVVATYRAKILDGVHTAWIFTKTKAIKAATVATKLYNTVVLLLTGNVKKAALAWKVFAQSIKANPYGLAMAAIMALVAGIATMARKFKEAKKENENFRKSLTDVSKAADQISKQELKRAQDLYRAATDESIARDKRLKAAQNMIQLYPDIFKNMSAEDIMLGKAKSAYDKLTESIKENARAKAAANRLEEIQGERLELELQKDQIEEENQKFIEKRDQARQNAQTIRNSRKKNSFFQNLFGGNSGAQARAYENMADDLDDRIQDNITTIRNLNLKINEYDQAIDQLAKKAKDALNIESPEIEENNETQEDSSGYSPGISDKKAAKLAKAAALKAKKDFKDGINAIKAEREAALAELNQKYDLSQISYIELIEQRKRVESEYYDKSLNFYEKNLSSVKDINLEDDKDYQELQRKKLETLQRFESQRVSYSAERIRQASEFEQKQLQEEYGWKENKSVIDEIELQEKILQIKIKYLRQEQELHSRASKEWEDIQLKIENISESARFDRELKLAKAAADFKKKYLNKSVEERFDIEKKVLDILLQQNKISKETYEQMVKNLEKAREDEKKSEKRSLPGQPNSQAEKNSLSLEKFQQDKEKLDKALEKGIINEEEYAGMLRNIRHEMIDSVTEGLENCGDQWTSLLAGMGKQWYKFFDSLGSGDWVESLQGAMAATVAVMGAAFQTITQFNQAELQIRTKQIEDYYDNEINRAQGNKRLVARLEKKKEEEIARIKDEAAQKEMAMQVISAIAQTATNALAAYGSAAAIPVVGHILAPIAAGIATASGMVQVALIKKQQQAAAATGYAEGGFTKPGAKYEPAGIVHAGEWVASQKLVKDPRTAPVIQLLEKAQRDNSLADFSLEQAQLFTGGPVASAKIYKAVDQENKQSSQKINVSVAGAENHNDSSPNIISDAIDRLVQRLQKPFITVNSMTGEDGFINAKNRYDRYMSNYKKNAK